jgi:hypothetical protein
MDTETVVDDSVWKEERFSREEGRKSRRQTKVKQIIRKRRRNSEMRDRGTGIQTEK